MGAIHITHWRCPNGHTAIAVAWNEGEHTLAQIEASGEALFDDGVFARRCALCGSTELTARDDTTQLPTVKAAAAHFHREQVHALALHRRLTQRRN